MGYPGIHAAVELAVSSALTRARALMEILDEAHQQDALYARMRAVRQELDTLHELFPVIGLPVVPLPTLPPLAKPSGEQQEIPTGEQVLDVEFRPRIPRDMMGNPLI